MGSSELLLYNTLSGREEPFRAMRDGEVRMYVCGPTVYDSCHLGHARSYVVFDVLARYLNHMGYRVRLVVNFTDVEQKITEHAEAARQDPLEFAEERIAEFFKEMDLLGVRRAEQYPRVSQYVPQMIEIVGRLIEAGYAYELGGRIYFDTEKAGGYGSLLHFRPEEAILKEKVDEEAGPRKRNPLDFELWDSTVKKPPLWDSPWGKGRIGWHVECYVMSRILGLPLDIKGGGADLVFPHHESTKLIANALGEELSRFYIHNAFLTFKERKMSKSTGIYVTIQDALRKCDPESIRFFLLGTHYRQSMAYSQAAILEAERDVKAVKAFVGRLRQGVELPHGPDDRDLLRLVDRLRSQFHASIRNDLDTPAASRAVMGFVRAADGMNVGSKASAAALATMAEIGAVLGIDLGSAPSGQGHPVRPITAH